MNKKMVLLSACMLTAGTLAAQKRVTGHVTNASGEPVMGAVVKVEGTKIFTRTDANGNFTLNGVPNATKKLNVSYLGMKSENVSVSAKMNVVLHDNQLEEAVVVGYGTARKMGTVVGSVSRVTADKIENKPVTTALDALQGKVAGVQIFNDNGDVGSISGTTTTVRGVGSLNGGTAPLYVVDGQPVDASVFYMLNPNDIASYSVMRDASATSIYGARASNGVIFVTTKRGRRGERAQIKVSQSIGWSMLAHRIGDPMDANQLLDLRYSNGLISTATYEKYKASGVNTDWQKYYFKDNAPMYNTNFSVAGASDRTSYYISGSYMKKDGLTLSSNFKRHTVRTNIETQATDWAKFGVNIGLNYTRRQTNPLVSKLWPGWNPVLSCYTMQPYVNPYNEDGSLAEQIPLHGWAPHMKLHYQNTHRNDARLTGSAFVALTPIEGLTIKSLFGADLLDQRGTGMHLPSDPALTSEGNYAGGSRSELFTRFADFTITNTAEYKFSLFEDHRFTVLLGQEGIKQTASNFKANSSGHSDDRLMNLQNGTTIDIGDVGSGNTEVQYLSFFGRLDYDLFRKYYANFTVRNDQSSKFGSANRSATFYSGGLMWNAKDEDFLKDVAWLDQLRLKGSVGSTGNSSGVGKYSSIALTGEGAIYNGEPTWRIATLGNPLLGWESQIQTTLGLNTRIFNRANIELNFYNRQTKDMLLAVRLPWTTGFSSQTLNVGGLSNRGIEFTFDVDAVKDWHGLNVNVYGNFTYNYNTIDKLYNGQDVDNGLSIWREGHSSTFYMAHRVGIDPADGKIVWAVPDKETLKPKYENGKMVTTKDFSNMDALRCATDKQTTAPINGGFGFSANWKGLTLNADFAYVLGKYMVNNAEFFSKNWKFVMQGVNADKAMADYWQQPGDVKEIPAFGVENQFDDSMLQNSSFLRLKNLSLSYDLPQAWIRKTGFVRNIRFSGTARNLLTFTKWTGADPEYADLIQMAGAVPNTREYTLGVEFTF